MKNLFSLLLIVFTLPAAAKLNSAASMNIAPPDVHSFARPQEAVVTHLNLHLEADFSSQVLKGMASWSIQNLSGTDTIWFDTNGGLQVTRVTLDGAETPTSFVLHNAVPVLGRGLAVVITKNTKQVNIYYETSPGASALQWLSPQQTSGKHQPFLFTQSEAILARTWIPCQDGPGVRFSYEATIHCPAQLLALMSASDNPKALDPKGEYHFSQPKAIPSYLMALAIGNIEYAPISGRCGVYAEPDMVGKSAWEFADMEKMVEAAEQLYGPYAWGRYDVIVLPPSFPFGGMENPCLTFATPTVVAGDRSLVSLVAHELAHSWSGNLTTNATWDDFWLNEGFTVYFEQRIMEALYGRSYSEMLASLNLDGVKGTIKDFIDSGKAGDTHLKLDLKGRDPDDGMTDVAYIKGYSFLRLLEEKVGRPAWDEFLRNYFRDHAFQSITTEQFLDYLRNNLINQHHKELAGVNFKEWIYGDGLPADCPVPDAERFKLVEVEINRFLTKGLLPDTAKTNAWSTHEWLHFLTNLPPDLTTAQMQLLDGAYHFTASQNCEIEDAWFLLAVQHGYSKAYSAMETFLVTVGRRKFLTPLYKEMMKTPAGKAMAIDIYAKARPNYHYVAQQTMDEFVK